MFLIVRDFDFLDLTLDMFLFVGEFAFLDFKCRHWWDISGVNSYRPNLWLLLNGDNLTFLATILGMLGCMCSVMWVCIVCVCVM